MACRKRRYATEGDAQIALALINPDSPTRHEQRVYGPCHFCFGYHLTSQKKPKDPVACRRRRP